MKKFDNKNYCINRHKDNKGLIIVWNKSTWNTANNLIYWKVKIIFEKALKKFMINKNNSILDTECWIWIFIKY